jgi:hypothetical protein
MKTQRIVTLLGMTALAVLMLLACPTSTDDDTTGGGGGGYPFLRHGVNI